MSMLVKIIFAVLGTAAFALMWAVRKLRSMWDVEHFPPPPPTIEKED